MIALTHFWHAVQEHERACPTGVRVGTGRGDGGAVIVAALCPSCWWCCIDTLAHEPIAIEGAAPAAPPRARKDTPE